MRNHIGTKPLVSRLLPSSDCACPRACPLQLQMLVTCTCTGHCTCESASGEALTTVTAVSAPADLAISTHVFTWHSRSINAACIRKPQLCIAARCASCVTLRSISCSETSARRAISLVPGVGFHRGQWRRSAEAILAAIWGSS